MVKDGALKSNIDIICTMTDGDPMYQKEFGKKIFQHIMEQYKYHYDRHDYGRL